MRTCLASAAFSGSVSSQGQGCCISCRGYIGVDPVLFEEGDFEFGKCPYDEVEGAGDDDHVSEDNKDHGPVWLWVVEGVIEPAHDGRAGLEHGHIEKKSQEFPKF